MFKSSTYFDKILDKATSLTNLEPDWTSILQICDTIRQNDVQPRYALNAIKKKLNATNPNVQLMALQVLESCVKNCGSIFHYELATKEFMAELHNILRNTTDTKVKNEILLLVQAWSHAFRKEPSFKAVQDEMKLMKAEGFQFPVFKESDVMFYADTAPEWSDGERCLRCRMQFSMIVRKHHCRHCGQVFCAKCSSKTSTIPKFGIEKEVRVCDGCYEKINKKIEIKPSPMDETKPKLSSNSNPPTPTKTKTEQEIQEEEELQLALALSKSEAESLEYEKMRQFKQNKLINSNDTNGQQSNHSKSHKKISKSSKSSSKSIKKSSKDIDIENEDPELARYLNREYWEQRSNTYGDYANSPSPSAPQPIANSTTKIDSVMDFKMVQQNKLIQSLQNDQELDDFTKNLQSTIEIFVNRLNSNKLRGRPITNDNGVQALFMNLTNMHSHLMMYMQQTSEARSNCERLQDKINQIRDARAALDALRDEHREQLKRAAAEAERIRQQQMAQKLEIMRKKKQEYLQYQRELAIQRMQEQERELMMRTEQLKFSSSQGNVPPMQVQPQWNMAPSTAAYPSGPNINASYYMDNANFSNSAHSTNQPHSMIGHNQPMMSGGQYGSPVSMSSNNSNLVTSHPPQPIMQPPVHMSTVHGHMMPQMISHYVAQPPMSAPQLYVPNAAKGYTQQEMTPNQYGNVPNTNTVHQEQEQQQPPQQISEVKEELLINFD